MAPSTTRALFLATTLALASPGCLLSNISPQARFSENAHTLTEASRWGHVDMAMPLISPKYAERYMARHREWGGGVTIADMELVRMQVAEDRKTALSEVTVNWYDASGVTLRSSTILQKWESDGRHFKLVDESVRAGDPALFAGDPEPSSES